jgi:actin-related protein
MGFAGNNDPQFIVPSCIATREAPSAATSGIPGRVGGQVAASKKG